MHLPARIVSPLRRTAFLAFPHSNQICVATSIPVGQCQPPRSEEAFPSAASRRVRVADSIRFPLCLWRASSHATRRVCCRRACTGRRRRQAAARKRVQRNEINATNHTQRTHPHPYPHRPHPRACRPTQMRSCSSARSCTSFVRTLSRRKRTKASCARRRL